MEARPNPKDLNLEGDRVFPGHGLSGVDSRTTSGLYLFEKDVARDRETIQAAC